MVTAFLEKLRVYQIVKKIIQTLWKPKVCFLEYTSTCLVVYP
jgi:hypothetical protein